MSDSNQKKILVLVADGTEEMEAIISIDVLRRASIEVTVAGVALKNGQYAECSRGVKIVPDVLFEHVLSYADSFDGIVIPGGYDGANTLSSHLDVQKLLQTIHQSGKLVAAICAGSLAIKTSDINKGGDITSHPSIKDNLVGDYNYREDRVVVNNKIITSRGPGTAFLFALTIVEQLVGREKRDEISSPMVLASTL
ncbi:hypothetical protein G9A89_016102 [Geosiphon pyriformis]|nr:hypothetical protein G9A89_016102 [Geosiphon pyriformis]